MSDFPDNLTVALIDNNGEHFIANALYHLSIFLRHMMNTFFYELLTYTKMVTGLGSSSSTIAVIEDGAMCSYPNREYNTLKQFWFYKANNSFKDEEEIDLFNSLVLK